MKRPFALTPTARNDLRAILLDIAEDSKYAAERVRLELLAELRKLGVSPGIGHYREDLLDRKYRFWTVYRYVIVYAWEPRPIEVISIVHGARDLRALFGPGT